MTDKATLHDAADAAVGLFERLLNNVERCNLPDDANAADIAATLAAALITATPGMLAVLARRT